MQAPLVVHGESSVILAMGSEWAIGELRLLSENKSFGPESNLGPQQTILCLSEFV